MAPHTLLVNGRRRRVDVDSSVPLLWVLRDNLGLTGAKYGCGIGACGACTVHVDGKAVRSCTMAVSSLDGKSVTTIEGLSRNGTHAVQRAWEAEDVPQCGYCQAGQIMSAAALLARTPKPSEAQINTAMNGNLCRCGTYLRIREAIQRAANMTARPTDTARAAAGV